MAKTVEFLFDVVSPTAYLAYKRLPDIAARTGAAIAWTPVFLGDTQPALAHMLPRASQRIPSGRPAVFSTKTLPFASVVPSTTS